MAYEICPEDKKKKSHMVCKHRHHERGKYKPCKHFKGSACAHPKRYTRVEK